MGARVAPLAASAPDTAAIAKPIGGAAQGRNGPRSGRVAKAVLDVYEFDGWARIWVAVCWFVITAQVISFSYPNEAGTYHAEVKALMTSYAPSPNANNVNVADVKTFSGGIEYALGFLAAYANTATAEGRAEGVIPLTEYDRVSFARIKVDLAPNCASLYVHKGLQCYKLAVDPSTGLPYDPDALDALAGPDGYRRVALMGPGTTRAQLTAAITQLENDDVPFWSTYGFEAVLELGVVNSLAPHYKSVYIFTIRRKSSGKEGLSKITTAIDIVSVRKLPMYTVQDDWVRLVMELLGLGFLFNAMWHEFLQFQMCRAWHELHLDPQLTKGWRFRFKRLVFFYSQFWNAVDLLNILNCCAWIVAYIVVVIMSFTVKTKDMLTLQDYDTMKDLASFRLKHIVWGTFTVILIGILILPYLKTHGGMRVYLTTVQLSWEYFKDLLLLFAVFTAIMSVLMSVMFAVTGANTLFETSSQTLLNLVLMTFQYVGFTDYFAYYAPTFGEYQLVFMLLWWVIVILLVVICQNLLLALVASAYEEAREQVGEVEWTHIRLTLYRLWWMAFSRWHRWILRKDSYTLFRDMLAATQKPDVWTYQRVFTRWALADLPETRLLALLYTDPTTDSLYIYSPWSWTRVSPMDTAQEAPWDEPLNYPMYSWADVTVSPSSKLRLSRMPPLFTATADRQPVSYNDIDPIFAMTEEEIDALLERVGTCWERMRHNFVVAKLAGLGWSEEGRALLREGLLEVYRRHEVQERTGTCTHAGSAGVRQAAAGGSGTKGAAALDEPPADEDGSVDAYEDSAMAQPSGQGPAAPSAHAAHAALAPPRGRPMSMFNRRGRISDNIDLLWRELSHVREEQAEIKALLEALLREQRGASSGPNAGPRLPALAPRTGSGSSTKAFAPMP